MRSMLNRPLPHRPRRTARCACAAFLVALSTSAASPAEAQQPAAASVKVGARQVGVSTRYIGVGYSYDEAGYAEGGFNTVFLGDSIEKWEPVNDTPTYGALTPDAVKRDPTVVPWAVWDGTLGSTRWRAIWESTKARGVRVVIGLRNQYRQTNWSANPPKVQADFDEWWEHVFALAYWLNVRNDYRVDDYQVLNEPDLPGIKPPGEGWMGTEAEYLAVVAVTRDALDHVYKTFLPDRRPTLLGPGVSFPAARTPPAPDGVALGLEGYWIKDLLKHAGPAIDAVSYHHYASASGLSSNIVAPVKSWVQSAGRPQLPLWITEWGGKTATVPEGVDAIRQLMVMSRPASYVTGSHYFVWGTLSSGGQRSTIFHALRLATTALQGAKPTLETTATGEGIDAIATRGEGGALNLLVTNTGAGPASVAVDVAAALPRVGRARLLRYDVGHGAAEQVEAPFTALRGTLELPAPGAALLQLHEEAVASPSPPDAGADAGRPGADAASGADATGAGVDAAGPRRDAGGARADAGAPGGGADEPDDERPPAKAAARGCSLGARGGHGRGLAWGAPGLGLFALLLLRRRGRRRA